MARRARSLADARALLDDRERAVDLLGRPATGAGLGDPAEQHGERVRHVVQRAGHVAVRIGRGRRLAPTRGSARFVGVPRHPGKLRHPQGRVTFQRRLGDAPAAGPTRRRLERMRVSQGSRASTSTALAAVPRLGGEDAEGLARALEGDVARLHDHAPRRARPGGRRPRPRAPPSAREGPCARAGCRRSRGRAPRRGSTRGRPRRRCGELLRVGDPEHAQREARRRVHPQRAAHGPEGQRHLEASRRGRRRRAARRRAAGSVPVRAANACAPASTARQSLPVAMTTASMPFMMPLLCVAARYGSSSAKRDALTMPSMTSVPLISSVASDARPGCGSAPGRSAGRRGSRGCAGPRARPAISASAVGDGLGDGVDEVRAHRVLAVDDDVDDDGCRRRAPAPRRRARRRPARDEAGHRRVGERASSARVGPDALDRGRARRARRGAAICAIMCGGSASATKPAARAHHLRGVRRGGDDARLLDDHRHDVVVPVDAHVERDAVGQRVGAEHVLDELVGRLRVEAARVERALDVPRVASPSRRTRARGAPGR